MKLDTFFSLYSDYNECLVENGGCDQNCTNKIPGFYCSCFEGYTLAEDGQSCNGNWSYVFSIFLRDMCDISIYVGKEMK